MNDGVLKSLTTLRKASTEIEFFYSYWHLATSMMTFVMRSFLFLVLNNFSHVAFSYLQLLPKSPSSSFRINMATFDEVNSPKVANSKILVGFTTDAWNVGMRKYKEFLAVHKMTWKVANHDVQCVEVRQRLHCALSNENTPTS